MKYGIQEGDIFIAADGGRYGHMVTDIRTFANVDDVVTTPFNSHGLENRKAGNRIDAYKLAMVRYYKPDVLPDWVHDLLT